MPQILTMGRRKQVISRICCRFWWQVGFSCTTNGGKFWKIQDIPYSRWVSPFGCGIFKKKKSRDTIHLMVNMAILTCCTGLTVHAANQPCHPKIKWNMKISSHWLVFQDYCMHRETECSRIWRTSTRFYPRTKTEYLRTTAKFCHPIEKRKRYNCLWWRWMGKAHFYVQITYSVQKPEDSNKSHQLYRQRNWSSLKYWDCYNYGSSWNWSASAITEFTRTLRMDFDEPWSRKISEWNSSSQLSHRELHFLVARERRQLEWCVSRIFLEGSHDSNNVKTHFEPSTLASTIWVASASSKSSGGGSSNPVSKAKSISEKEIPQKDRIWTITPGSPKCKRDSLETRISKCITNMVRHHDQDERETDGARHWDGVLSVLKGKFRNQLDKEFMDEDWLHCLYLGMIKTRFAICKMKNAELRCSRSIQGHSGGMVISPRLMNHVMIPYKYKQFFIMWVEHEINTPLQELN